MLVKFIVRLGNTIPFVLNSLLLAVSVQAMQTVRTQTSRSEIEPASL